jgi:hypothetical protein
MVTSAIQELRRTPLPRLVLVKLSCSHHDLYPQHSHLIFSVARAEEVSRRLLIPMSTLGTPLDFPLRNNTAGVPVCLPDAQFAARWRRYCQNSMDSRRTEFFFHVACHSIISVRYFSVIPGILCSKYGAALEYPNFDLPRFGARAVSTPFTDEDSGKSSFLLGVCQQHQSSMDELEALFAAFHDLTATMVNLARWRNV